MSDFDDVRAALEHFTSANPSGGVACCQKSVTHGTHSDDCLGVRALAALDRLADARNAALEEAARAMTDCRLIDPRTEWNRAINAAVAHIRALEDQP